MRYTLLEMVQSILASMQSDEANSISDSTESYDLAVMLRDLYYDLAVTLNVPEHETLVQLNASGSSLKPTLMTLPSNVVTVKSIKYDKRISTDTEPVYGDVGYLPFSDFLAMIGSFKDATNSVTYDFLVNGETYTLWARTDVGPQYWTAVDDTTIIMDSHDSTVDTTLQKTKTLCEAVIYPEFTLSDSFTPSLSIQQFPYFLNMAKARAFEEAKQMPHRGAEKAARKIEIVNQKRERRAMGLSDFERLPKFGR